MRYPPIIKGFVHMLHGGDYNPDQWRHDKSVWQEDMRLARLAHCNALSVGIFAWAALEPEEGVYDFGWLDEVMDLLAENGMTAVLATPSGARPAWMSHKYPQVLRANADRHRISHGGRHNHCYTSPIYRQKTQQINGLLAERYKDHPALGMWHLSNEYGGQCHCDLCQQAFRQWLKTRYESLDELNLKWWTAFWSHTYTDWSQIESPGPRGETHLHALNLDWMRFVTEQTADFMRHEMEPLRRITPDVPCTTNMMGLYDGLNYFRLAESLDVASWDNYPIWKADASDGREAARIGMIHDLNRCLKDGRPFMLMESSASATNWQPVAKLRRPGGVLLYGMQAVAHGSDTIQYFQFRKSRGGSEKFHGALVDHVGNEHTRVFGEVAQTGAALARLDDVVGTIRPAQAALIYDVENRWALEGSAGFKIDKKYTETLAEHYRPLWQMGIATDVIDSTKPLDGYKLVIAPMLYMLRPGMAQKLRDFVSGGGTLVCTYATGYVDENDLCFLGGFLGPLKDVLGLWCEEIDALYDGEERGVSYGGRRYRARDLCELIHLRGAKAQGEYTDDFYEGMPAVTVNDLGHGRAWFIAARLDDSFHDDFYGQLARELELYRPFEAALPEGCTAQARTDGENEYVFIMNFMPTPASIDVGAGGVSLLTGEPVGANVSLDARGLEILRRPLEKRPI